MSEIILPLAILTSTLLVRILSIRVAELLKTHVALSIVGINEKLCRVRILSIRVAELLKTHVALSIAGINEKLCRESKKS